MTKPPRHTAFWAVVCLCVAGALGIGLRWQARHQAGLDHGDTLWRVTYKTHFQATRAGAKLRVSIPSDSPHARVFRQDMLYSGLAAERLRSSRQMAREVSLAASRHGPHTLTARFDIHLSPHAHWRVRHESLPSTPAEREEYLRSAEMLPVQDKLVLAKLDRLRLVPGTETNLVQRIFDYCAAEITDQESQHDPLGVLREGRGSTLGRARLMVTLCRAAGMPARVMSGFRLEEVADLPPQFWAEVLIGNAWIPFHPAAKLARDLPAEYVPVRHTGLELVHGTDIAALETSISAQPLPSTAGTRRSGRGFAALLDLTRLPLEMHEVMSVILLLPLGALVTAFFRTVVGVRTFGTFSPTLMALAFVYANWITGLLTFVVVLSLGLMTRTVLDRLKLLVVPRLSVVLTLVVMIITLMVSVLDYFNLTPSAQAVILPMVILTMTIERFFITAEEDSPAFALQLLLTTFFLGACCYAVLRWQTVGHLVFTYPEIHFFTIAVLILLGRYSGYRLTELWRFRDLKGTTL